MPEPSPPKRSRLWLKIAIAIVLLLGVAWGALVIAFPPARVRDLVQKQLSVMLAREVRFEDTSVGLFPPVRMTVKGLALAEPGGFARGTAFKARSVHLDVAVLPLLARRIVIRRLVIEGPQIHLVLRPNGTTNLDSLGKPEEPSRRRAPMDLAMNEIRIVDGRVLVEDLAARRRLSFALGTKTDLGLTGGGTRVRTSGETSVSDLAYGPLSARTANQLNRSLAKLEWKIGHRGTLDLASRRLQLEKLSLDLGRTALSFTGTVDAGTTPTVVDLRARGKDVDLAQVLDYLAAADARVLNGIKGGGKLRFDLGVRGPLVPGRRPALDGTFAVANGSFRYPEAPVGVDDASFDGRISRDSLVIANLKALVSGQTVSGNVAVSSFEDPRVRFRIKGLIDLAAVSRLLASRETKLAGKAAVDLGGSGRAKDPGAMALEGWTRFADVSVTTPQLPKKLEQISGEISFSQARAQVRRLNMHAGRSSFTLEAMVTHPLAVLAKLGTVPPANVEFSFVSPYLDLVELLPPVPGGPMMANANGGGRVSIARLKNKKLDVEKVSAAVALAPGKLEVVRFDLSGYGGTGNGTAHFDYRDVMHPAAAVEVKLNGVRADEVLATWTGAGKIFRGALGTDFDLALSGTRPEEILQSLTGKGEAAIINGTFGPTPLLEAIAAFTHVPDYREMRFKDLKTPFRIDHGRVATGPARLVGPYGDWLVSGTVGFDGRLDYFMSVAVPPEAVARIGSDLVRLTKPLADENGRVMIDLRVTGPAKAPRVTLDREAMQRRLLGGLSQSLGKKGLIPSQLIPFIPGASQIQPGDSAARAQAKAAQRALEDSLKKEARKLLKNLFGAPKDTGRSP